MEPQRTVLFGRGRAGPACYHRHDFDARRCRTILKSYSTAYAGRGNRLTYWNDLHCNVLLPLEVKPADRESFDAAFSIDVLGPLSFVKTFSRPALIEHTDRHVKDTTDRSVFLIMPILGQISSSHYGREVTLNEGDFVLSDSYAPSRTTLPYNNQALIVGLPYDTLTAYVPDPEAVFGRRVCGSAGFGHTVNAWLRSFWAQIESGVPARFGSRIAKNLLDLVATAYAFEYETEIAESALAAGRRGQIKRHIETHLRDSDLTTTVIGAALGLSPRYIRMVFAAENESIADYILRRRLEECAVQLGNVLWTGRSITEIAFDWGFSSMAHFTRAFKDRFAVTPTEYKRSHGRATQSIT